MLAASTTMMTATIAARATPNFARWPHACFIPLRTPTTSSWLRRPVLDPGHRTVSITALVPFQLPVTSKIAKFELHDSDFSGGVTVYNAG